MPTPDFTSHAVTDFPTAAWNTNHAWEPRMDADENRAEMAAGSVWTGSYVPVTLSGGQVIPATDGTAVAGVAVKPPIAIGDPVIVVHGHATFDVPVVGGVTVAPGAKVYMAQTYSVDLGTSGDLSCGTAVGPVSVTGPGVVRIILNATLNGGTTHA